MWMTLAFFFSANKEDYVIGIEIESLVKLQKWCNYNSLKINTVKTKAVLFDPKHKNP